ncbi:MAG TPA: ribonuclease III [Terriglobia bacterium]|nr:ribonuclease III [Terriglobia bacterium]
MSLPSYDRLQEILDYRFRNPQLLADALTHVSYAREFSGQTSDNEKLEFLGDAILNFVVSVRLADAFPSFPEGKLSRARSRLVAAEHLSEVAAQLQLGQFLRLGRGEEKTGGRAKNRLVVNALEAVVAAIYRDGGLQAARRFIAQFILPVDLPRAAGDLFIIDYKSALQEFLQARQLQAAEYQVVAESGPEHRKVFSVVAQAAGKTAIGTGVAKKSAEQSAAEKLLESLKQIGGPQ